MTDGLYFDVVEARAKLKIQGKTPKSIHIRPERMRELKKNVHTAKWTSIVDSRSLGMKSGMKVYHTILDYERVIAEDGTEQLLLEQMPTPMRKV